MFRAPCTRAETTLADIASGQDLDHLLASRRDFAKEVLAELRERVSRWGVHIEALEIRALKINDPEIERSIARRASAGKEAEGDLVRAQMQVRIVQALNEAGSTMTESGWRLKLIETLIEATRGPNNTIVLPSQFLSLLGSALSHQTMENLAPHDAPKQ